MEEVGEASEREARHVMTTTLAMLALVASCSKSAPPAPEPVGARAPLDGKSDLDIPGHALPMLLSSNQVVTAIVADWTSTRAELRLWERELVGSRRGAWKLVMGPWPGVVGVSGTAWGVGVHGTVPQGRGGPIKREGDGKSPAGVFEFRAAYGYATSAKSQLPYRAVEPSWKCVDDPKSKHYTRVFDSKGIDKDWASAEEMRRSDELYKWVVDVAHNPSAEPGKGSCIFLHVWSGPESTTVGCTAMEATQLATLIERLDPKAMYVLLPKAEYDALATTWGLP